MNELMRTKSVMLSHIVIALFFCFFSGTSFAGGSWNGWVYQAHYPTGVDLGDVKFISPLQGWIVGKYGSIFHTADGGETWEMRESGTEEHLLKVFFVNEKSGWVAGIWGSILHTGDGGKTWVAQYNIKSRPTQIFFVNEQEGWLTGTTQAGGAVYHTRNGGKTWEKPNIGISRAVSGVFFITAQSGWILAGEDVYRTTDGGQKWELSKLPVGKMRRWSPPLYPGERPTMQLEDGLGPQWFYGGIIFTNEKQGWAAVYHWIFHTEDGGRIWAMQFDTGKTDHTISKIDFRDAFNGCAAGWSVVCTEDGGKTWSERLGLAPNDEKQLGGVSLTGQSDGWTVGGVGWIYKTTDGGRSWKYPVPRIKCGDHLIFIDKKMRWLWGTWSSSICSTDDEGKTWIKQDMGMRLKDLFFINSLGWALGCQEEGQEPNNPKKVFQVLKHTTDDGKTWVVQFKELIEKTSCFPIDLSSILFVNGDAGWIVGNNGRILHTDSGGAQWKRQQSGTTLNLQELDFLDNKIGIISGDRRAALGEDRENDEKATGRILYTDDGGKHWRTTWEKKTVLLTGFFSLDKNSVWATAETLNGNLLLYSDNGGKTWKEQSLNIYGFFPYSPYFLDKNRGVLFLEDNSPGAIRDPMLFVTNNGGKTWAKTKIPLKKQPWHISELFKKPVIDAK